MAYNKSSNLKQYDAKGMYNENEMKRYDIKKDPNNTNITALLILRLITILHHSLQLMSHARTKTQSPLLLMQQFINLKLRTLEDFSYST